MGGIRSNQLNKSWPNQDNSILDIFWTFFLKPLQPFTGLFSQLVQDLLKFYLFGGSPFGQRVGRVCPIHMHMHVHIYVKHDNFNCKWLPHGEIPGEYL